MPLVFSLLDLFMALVLCAALFFSCLWLLIFVLIGGSIQKIGVVVYQKNEYNSYTSRSKKLHRPASQSSSPSPHFYCAFIHKPTVMINLRSFNSMMEKTQTSGILRRQDLQTILEGSNRKNNVLGPTHNLTATSEGWSLNDEISCSSRWLMESD